MKPVRCTCYWHEGWHHPDCKSLKPHGLWWWFRDWLASKIAG